MIEQDIAAHANAFAPRRRRAERSTPPQEAQMQIVKDVQQQEPETPAQVPAETPRQQQLLTPNSLKIAESLDRMERDREQAIEQRNDLQDQLSRALARIEQFEHRNAEIQREKEALEIRLTDANHATELERNERIRLSDAMESVIELLRQKLRMPEGSQ